MLSRRLSVGNGRDNSSESSRIKNGGEFHGAALTSPERGRLELRIEGKTSRENSRKLHRKAMAEANAECPLCSVVALPSESC
jgi:hypothetical protein